MLSTQYRLRLEFICKKIANKEEVKLDDMIWAEKLSKANTTAREWLRKARRHAAQDIQEGSMDDFMNKMGLGDPDPSPAYTQRLDVDAPCGRERVRAGLDVIDDLLRQLPGSETGFVPGAASPTASR